MTATVAGSAAASLPLHNVFVYGSLLADEIFIIVLMDYDAPIDMREIYLPKSKSSEIIETISPKFSVLSRICFRAITSWICHRYSIKGRVYPAILPVESKKVIGRVIMGVTDAELYVLDTFEDEEYKRNTVEVFLNDDSGELFAETYVWADKDDPKLYGEWDFEEWKKLHLKDFLSMTEGFIKELEQLELKTRVATYEAYYKKL